MRIDIIEYIMEVYQKVKKRKYYMTQQSTSEHIKYKRKKITVPNKYLYSNFDNGIIHSVQDMLRILTPVDIRRDQQNLIHTLTHNDILLAHKMEEILLV